MILTPNSRSERVVAVCAKVTACVLLFIVATALVYFAFDDLANRLTASVPAAIFSVLFTLAFSGAMFLFLYSAAKTGVEDYAIQIRILKGHGFRRVKHMTAEEFDRLAAMERSIDEEILERTREREKS